MQTWTTCDFMQLSSNDGRQGREVKFRDTDVASISALPFPSCATLSKYLSSLSFRLICKNEDNSAHFKGYLWGLSETIIMPLSEWFPRSFLTISLTPPLFHLCFSMMQSDRIIPLLRNVDGHSHHMIHKRSFKHLSKICEGPGSGFINLSHSLMSPVLINKNATPPTLET